MIMYANDTSILISNNRYKDHNRGFNKVLYNTLKWFQANQLVLNMEKATIAKFTPSNLYYFPMHTTFADHLFVATNAKKFLGLQLDSHLPWKPYINYLLHNLNSVCYMRRLSHVLNIQTLKSVYFVHFHSLVNYGIIFCNYIRSVYKAFITQKKRYCKLCWELVQGVPAGNCLNKWRFLQHMKQEGF